MGKALIISFAYICAMHVLALAVALCNAHPVYRLIPHGAAVAIRREPNGYYRAEERIAFSTAGPPAQAATHAGGHGLIAVRYARESDGTVSGIGSSPALARQALARAVAMFIADSKVELEREERSYDRVTSDGRAQERGSDFGYPGGRDLTNVCRP